MKTRKKGDDLVMDAEIWSSEGGNGVLGEGGARWRLDLAALMAEEDVVASKGLWGVVEEDLGWVVGL